MYIAFLTHTTEEDARTRENACHANSDLWVQFLEGLLRVSNFYIAAFILSRRYTRGILSVFLKEFICAPHCAYH